MLYTDRQTVIEFVGKTMPVSTYNITEIPTMLNYPTSDWNVNSYESHIGDVAIVNNSVPWYDGANWSADASTAGAFVTDYIAVEYGVLNIYLENEVSLLQCVIYNSNKGFVKNDTKFNGGHNYSFSIPSGGAYVKLTEFRGTGATIEDIGRIKIGINQDVTGDNITYYVFSKSQQDYIWTLTDEADVNYNKDMVLYNGIEDGSMDLSEVLCSGDDIEFGVLNADKFEVTIYGIDDVTGEQISVKQNVVNSKGVTEAIPIFKGYVDSCEYDENLHYRKIVAYNSRVKRSGVVYAINELDASDWWNNYWQTATLVSNLYRISTVYDLFKSLMNYYSIPFSSQPFIENPTIKFAITQDDDYYKIPSLENCTVGSVLRMIGEVLFAIPHMSRDGYMYLRGITEQYYQVTENNNVEVLDTKYEAYTVPRISGAYVYCSDLLNSNSKGGYGTADTIYYKPSDISNPYVIKDNFLIHGLAEDMQTYLSRMIASSERVSYQPVEMKTIISDYDAGVGSMVNYGNRISFIFENHLSGALLIEQELTSRGSLKRSVDIVTEDKYVDDESAGGVNVLTNSKLMTNYTIKEYLSDGSNRLTDGSNRLFI